MTIIDSRASLVIQPFIFEKGDWEFSGESVCGIPGTWDKLANGLETPNVLALVCCPNCHNISVIHRQVSCIDGLGKITPSFICKYERCEFHRDAYLDLWNNKPLYAMAIVRRGKQEMMYTHASTADEARVQLGYMGPGEYIIGIGRAIGYFLEDKKGDVLNVD